MDSLWKISSLLNYKRVSSYVVWFKLQSSSLFDLPYKREQKRLRRQSKNGYFNFSCQIKSNPISPIPPNFDQTGEPPLRHISTSPPVAKYIQMHLSLQFEHRMGPRIECQQAGSSWISAPYWSDFRLSTGPPTRLEYSTTDDDKCVLVLTASSCHHQLVPWWRNLAINQVTCDKRKAKTIFTYF